MLIAGGAKAEEKFVACRANAPAPSAEQEACRILIDRR
jgi:hypothetical protein